MESEGLRSRTAAQMNEKEHGQGNGQQSEQPADKTKHSPLEEALRIVLLILYFVGSCASIHLTQIFGSWLYFYRKDWYYSWMAVTKQHFALLIITMQQWWMPVNIRVSWEKDLQGQFRRTEGGRLELDFPERIVLIANHQIYSDWLYLWWIAYAAKMHGHIYIILKESLRWIPILGPGMQFFSFIFMSRKWESDKPRLQHRLQKLVRSYSGGTGRDQLDPMWLLVFPEGTNLSGNTRKKSVAWAQKQGIEDMKHQLLPRSTGTYFCLNELKGTVDYVYDCTVAYENVSRDAYAQDLFTLRGMYFQGRTPPSVNLYWRRFAVSSIPLDNSDDFSAWLLERWREKDALLEQFLQTGRFPAADKGETAAGRESVSGQAKHSLESEKSSFIETEVQPRNPFEFLQMFVPWIGLVLLLNVFFKIWSMLKLLMFWR